ncbi:MAG TPA: hypothetical protein VHH14_00210, partial [Solirubrobacterales bacterium]|nr:hypothetical protein [Solirubrobacterales bacterium]
MTRLSPLKLFAAVAAVVALGVLAVVLLAGGDGEDPQRSADSAKPANARVAAQKAKVRKAWQGLVRKGLKQAGGREVLADWPFSAVRKPEGGMPPRLRAGVGEVLPGSEPLRLRFDEAGYATTPAGGLWVVPGRAVVCIFRAQTLS